MPNSVEELAKIKAQLNAGVINSAIDHFKPGEFEYGRQDTTLRKGNDGSRFEGDTDKDGKKGVDCSSLVWRALRDGGFDVEQKIASRAGFTTKSLFTANSSGVTLTQAAKDNFDSISVNAQDKVLKPGDLLLFPGHIAIFKQYDDKGNIQFFGSQTSTGPAVVTMDKGYWEPRLKGALRPSLDFVRPDVLEAALKGKDIDVTAISEKKPVAEKDTKQAQQSEKLQKNSVLVKGSKGGDVIALQTKLNQLYPDQAQLETKTGIYGDLTKAAVEAFQRAYDLEVDGKVGKETFAKLDELLAKVQTANAPEHTVSESQPDLATLRSELAMTQANIAALQEKISALTPKDAEIKAPAAEAAINISIVDSSRSIMFQENAKGLVCQVDGKSYDMSAFTRFGEKMSEMETYQNSDRSLLGKHLPEANQFEVYLKGAGGANKIAVVNEFSEQQSIQLSGQAIAQNKDQSQQKTMGSER